MGVFWLAGGCAAAALLYWLIVIGEGAYLGPWAVRLVYRLGARHYDAVRAPTQADDAQVLLPLLRAALAGVARPAILDVATGTGRVPLLLACAPLDYSELVGLDLTPQMLERARASQAARCPQAAIRWQLGEAGRLGWPAGHFDLVSCLEALEYFPRPQQALAEMARVLRPGGTLVLSKWPDGWARSLPGRALTAAALRRTLAGLGFAGVEIRPWQPGNYELVIAKKYG
jgi:ubiquinone/menaquinone biosynthesis C-methylase UbiE